MAIKTLLLIALVMLLPLSALAQGETSAVPKQLDSLAQYVFVQLGTAATGDGALTTARMYTLINRAYATVCHEFPAIERFDTVVISAAMEGGALNADFSRARAVYKFADSSRVRIPLEFVEVDSLRALMADGDYAQDKSKPTSPGRYSTWNSVLLTYPKVGKAAADPDSFLVCYYANAERLVAGGDSVAFNPKYIEPLLAWATAKGAAARNNFTDADWYMADYKRLKGEMVKPAQVELER
ncbi:MAG TPA: hypothetical protein VFI02_14035 [Armatimonadota bacterium]|nr:hypothetical protein [Armatimonadota bacterium]